MKKDLSMRLISEKINYIEAEIVNCEPENFSQRWFNKKYKEKLLLQKEMIELELKLYE